MIPGRKWQVPLSYGIAAIVIVLAVSLFSPVVRAGGGQKGGAELWANNCRQCHNYRPPSSYSSDQWDIAVSHMRFRCGLTANEARKIVEFLKNAN